MSKSDATFSGAVAQFYDRYLSAMFRDHALPIVDRLATLDHGALLEVAAGTGNVTVLLAERLPQAVAITATDLNQPMLDLLATKPGVNRVAIRQADALALPFADAAFDALVCQFGVMFYPDRTSGHAEAHRVLKPGGRYLFNVWDSLDANPGAQIVDQTVSALFPANPPAFLRRTPYGYRDIDRIRADLRAGGFADATIDAVPAEWTPPNLTDAAVAICQGTPLRAEIEARDPAGVQRVTEAVAQALLDRFGPCEQRITTQSLLIEARR